MKTVYSIIKEIENTYSSQKFVIIFNQPDISLSESFEHTFTIIMQKFYHYILLNAYHLSKIHLSISLHSHNDFYILKINHPYAPSLLTRCINIFYKQYLLHSINKANFLLSISKLQTATFRGQQGRISRPVKAILSGRL